ncbi:MAG: hypothetical protein JXB30_18315, partial [Anaerolineae bacterium]|nr:hypothetical protein [Anaerolineae bacterium]
MAGPLTHRYLFPYPGAHPQAAFRQMTGRNQGRLYAQYELPAILKVTRSLLPGSEMTTQVLVAVAMLSDPVAMLSDPV